MQTIYERVYFNQTHAVLTWKISTYTTRKVRVFYEEEVVVVMQIQTADIIANEFTQQNISIMVYSEPLTGPPEGAIDH